MIYIIDIGDIYISHSAFI